MGEASWNCRRSVVDQRRAEHRGFAQLFGVSAAVEDAVHGGQAVAADDAVGVGVVEAVGIAAEEQRCCCR